MQKLGNVLINVMQDLSRVSTNGSAHVKVNDHICDEREFEALFNHFTRGTMLERIDLKVEPLETVMDCACGHNEKVDDPDHNGYDRCPSCGRFADIKDDPYHLVDPNPDNAGSRKSIRF